MEETERGLQEPHPLRAPALMHMEPTCGELTHRELVRLEHTHMELVHMELRRAKLVRVENHRAGSRGPAPA